MSKELEIKGPGSLAALDDLMSDDLPVVSSDEIDEMYNSIKSCYMVGLFDATGSMDALWSNTRSSLIEILDRLAEFDGDFNFQWVAYRDYSEGSNIIEKSGWSSEKRELLRFIEGIECYGGWGPEPLTDGYEEAVEKALQVAADDESATHVLLIADAPAHPEGDWLVQANRLATLKRPVYCFVVGGDEDDQGDNETYANFSEIAKITGGVCGMLNNMDELIDVVVMATAYATGGAANLLTYESTHKLGTSAKKLKKQLLMLEN